MSYSSSPLAVNVLPNNETTFTFTIFKFNYVMRHDSIRRGTLNLYTVCYYRGADKSLDRPGRKTANISVRMA